MDGKQVYLNRIVDFSAVLVQMIIWQLVEVLIWLTINLALGLDNTSSITIKRHVKGQYNHPIYKIKDAIFKDNRRTLGLIIWRLSSDIGATLV